MSENKTTEKKTTAAKAVKEMNIYQKMATITNELQTVAKNLVVEITKNNSYKAVSERDIIDAVKPVELKNGVYSYPVSREVLESHILESEKVWNGQATKTTSFFSRIKTIYRFVNVDNPEEYIETTVFAEGIDSQDKGSGKAMTYADKYALMKAYKISTGEDPDQDGSKETHYTKTTDKPSKLHIDALKETAKKKGVDIKRLCTKYGLSKIEDISAAQYAECARGLNSMPDIE